MSYVLTVIFLIQIQFLNMAIPGRFSHVVITLFVFILIFIFKKKLNFSERKLLIISVLVLLYGFIVSAVGFLSYSVSKTNLFYLSDSVVALIYLTIFIVTPAIIYFQFSSLNVERFCYLILFLHSVTLISAILQVLNLFPNETILNANDVYVYGRISILDKEPSVASYRLFFLLWLVFFIKQSFYSSSFKFYSLYSFVYMILLVFSIVSVKSKLVVLLIPIILVVATFHYFFSKRKISFKKLLLFVFIFSFFLYFVTESDYFNYAVQYTFVHSDGSFSTRALVAIESVRMLLFNPFGVGMSYPLYLQEYIENSSLLSYFYNSEIKSYVDTSTYSTLISPKSFLLTSLLILGFPFVFLVILIVRNIVKLSINTNCFFINLAFMWFSIFYMVVSDFNIQPLLYFSIYMVIIKSYERKNYC
ncbi:hypothetical protein J3455_07205 [Pseudoalteromonas sp. NFXS39]|uniref:hypothetical protein n=1 Tax=Pseudoalteromonas sp. NFXS39 TaxID=2818437 RepID=UPI0032DED7C6